jgi:hypothetical protein
VKRFCLAGILVMMLAACASSGPRIDPAQLSDLRQGETTVNDVLKRFGRPSVLSKNMDGTQTAAYMWAEDRTNAGALVPLMSAWAGKVDADVDAVIFRFDVNGRLSGYQATQAERDDPEPARTVQAAPGAQGAPTGQAGSAAQTEAATQPRKAATRKPWSFGSFQPLRQVDNPP